MTKDGEGGICEVWRGKRDANSIKERCDGMFGTVTVLDLGLESCQMLELGINRCSTLQGCERVASQSLHVVWMLWREICSKKKCVGVASCVFESRNVLKGEAAHLRKVASVFSVFNVFSVRFFGWPGVP